MASTYADNVSSIVGRLYADKLVRAELSPGARAALDLTQRSLIEVTSGGTKPLTDAMTDLALAAATKILRSAATTVGLDALAGAVPFLGGFVSAVAAIAGGPKAQGVGYSASDQKMYCARPVQEGGWFRSIRQPGTGPGGQLVACDLMVFDSGTSKTGKRWVDPTEMAWAIQLTTETEGVHGGAGDAKKYLGTYGLPPERRVQYQDLRQAIQSTYKRFGTDGGASLWIVYVDMLRADFDAGRLSPLIMRYLHVLEGGAHNVYNYPMGDYLKPYNEYTGGTHTAQQHAQDKRDVASIILSKMSWSTGKGLNPARAYAAELIPDGRAHFMCGLWTGAARQQVLDLIQVWHQTLTPYYTQFESLEEQAKKAADAYFGKTKPKPAPGVKFRAPAVVSAAKQKRRAAVAVGAVGGAAGLAWYATTPGGRALADSALRLVSKAGRMVGSWISR